MPDTYIDRYRAVLLEELARVDPGWTPGERLLDLYLGLVMTVGEACESWHVHDMWGIDAVHERPAHPDLIPFHRLSPEVQSWDDRYRDAIRATAARLDARAA
jgi:hypothetical protein